MDPILDRLAFVIFGGIIGFTANFFVRMYFDNRAEKYKRIDNLIEFVKFLNEMAISYWSHSEQDISNDPNKVALPHRLIASQHFLNETIARLANGSQKFEKITQVKCLQLMDLVTGGDFQVKSRKASPERCGDIHLSTYKLISALNDAKNV